MGEHDSPDPEEANRLANAISQPGVTQDPPNPAQIEESEENLDVPSSEPQFDQNEELQHRRKHTEEYEIEQAKLSQ